MDRLPSATRKPVPVNFGVFETEAGYDYCCLAALLKLDSAIFSAGLLTIVVMFPEGDDRGRATLFASMSINLILFIFNMLPVPPLDGGRVAVVLLPPPWGQIGKVGTGGAIILAVLFVCLLLSVRH